MAQNAQPDWNRITALCALFVAVVALAVAVVEARETRRHYRLSLTPAMVYWVNTDPLLGPLGIIIRNEGLGPAFIDSLVVFDNERRVGTWDDQTWEYVADALAIPDSVRAEVDLAMFEPGAVVRQGGEWVLCGFPASQSAQAPWVDAITGRFGFVLWYRSAYDEPRIQSIVARNLPAEVRIGPGPGR